LATGVCDCRDAAANKPPILEQDDPLGSRLLLAESAMGEILIAGSATTDDNDPIAAGASVHEVVPFPDGRLGLCTVVYAAWGSVKNGRNLIE
jgi:hypothetical protein